MAAYLNAPITFLAILFFIRKTKRTKIEISSNDYLDLALSLTIAVWFW
jgi:hypothetical protein